MPLDGVYEVQYRIEGWQGNLTQDSFPAPVIIDRTPPYYRPDAPHTPAALILPSEPITDDYLNNNGDQVICQVPAYPGKARGDTVYLFWGPSLPDNVNSPPIVPPVEIPDDQQVAVDIPIPRSEIETRADGVTYAVYWLSDKAGNFSDISTPATTDVQLGPLPDNLQPPRVPLAPISRADALEPVEVEIDVYDNPGKSVIKATWEDAALNDYSPGAQPIFPLRITVPWSVLKAGYDFDGPEEQTVTVGYQAWRGPLKFPDDPLTVDVVVDLSIVGPENPDEPHPVNPDLPLAVLTSSQGRENVLDSGDLGQDADVEVELHADPVVDEIIDLYWRDVKVDSVTLDGSEQEGDPIRFTLPWDAIDEGGNDPKFPMSYTIRAGNGMNPQRSQDTEVDVSVVTISLAPPFFPTMDPVRNIINCCSLNPADLSLPLSIPGNPRYLQDGMVVVISSYGTNTAEPDLVPGTDFELRYTLEANESINGARVNIAPYDQKLLPIRTGRLMARYTVVLNGQEVESSQAINLISLGLSGGGTCDPADPCPTP